MDPFTAAQYSRTHFVDRDRTSGADRRLTFLPGYVERVFYFVQRKACYHGLVALADEPTWPNVTVTVPFAGQDYTVTIARSDLESFFGEPCAATLARWQQIDKQTVTRWAVQFTTWTPPTHS